MEMSPSLKLILRRLARGPATAQELGREVRMLPHSVRRQLRKAQSHGLICVARWRKRGRYVIRVYGLGEVDAPRPPREPEQVWRQRYNERRRQRTRSKRDAMDPFEAAARQRRPGEPELRRV